MLSPRTLFQNNKVNVCTFKFWAEQYSSKKCIPNEGIYQQLLNKVLSRAILGGYRQHAFRSPNCEGHRPDESNVFCLLRMFCSGVWSKDLRNDFFHRSLLLCSSELFEALIKHSPGIQILKLSLFPDECRCYFSLWFMFLSASESLIKLIRYLN